MHQVNHFGIPVQSQRGTVFFVNTPVELNRSKALHALPFA
jgi:hypothetical protein